MKKINKLITLVIIFLLITFQPASVLAIEIPSAPTPPPAPTDPAVPTPPSIPTPPAQSAPTPPPSATQQPSSTPKPSSSASANPTSSPESSASPTASPSPSAAASQSSDNSSATSNGAVAGTSQTNDPGNSTGGQTTTGGTGDTTLVTGNATNAATAASIGNNNLNSTTPSANSTGASVSNTGNGTGSSNNSSASVNDSNNSQQANSANVGNDLNLSTTTGDNALSKNTNGDATLVTGDANTSGTVITAVNSNVNGVGVAEFNIADNHTGDIILDFNANCVSNCANGTGAKASNTGNGADSQNNSDVTQNSSNNTFQANDANVGSNLTLSANTGDNLSNKNTGGDTTIATGDANVSGNVLTFANNNIAGNVIYGVVNIFGNLVGDIILPESAVNSASTGCSSGCASSGSTTASNVGNGSGSTNNADATQNTANNTFQSNDASIQNNLLLDTNTGGNISSQNTDGSSNIVTGDSNLKAQTLNVANSNIDGGTYWLVLVNQAGKWIGKILGAPEGSNMAGSQGTEFMVDDQGQVTAVVNGGNGADSTNNSSVSQNNSNTTSQSNNANIVNNLNLSANTGKNDATKNTGGASTIYTGDTNVIASLVNFVNNNIVGNGKLVVTVVNVFGSWVGDLVTPGQTKQNKTASTSQGGPAQLTQASATPKPSASPSQSPQQLVVGQEQDDPYYGNGQTRRVVRRSYTSAWGMVSNNVLGVMNYLPNQNPVQVAGIKLATENGVVNPMDAIFSGNTQSKAIKINLAYIILILPLLIAGVYVARRLAVRRFFTKFSLQTLKSILFSFF